MITAAPPMSAFSVLGVLMSAAALLATAFVVAEKRRQLLVAGTLALAALVPFGLFLLRPGTFGPRLAQTVFAVNMIVWVLFTLAAGLIVFRGLLRARSIAGNEVYGAIYMYL